MNEGHPLNNGEKHDNFSLVRKPSSVLEKTKPGAKLILSGMVADTLALVPEDKKTKPIFWIATCGGELTSEASQLLFIEPLQKIFGNSYKVERCDFQFTDDLLDSPDYFDLVVLLRWPYSLFASPLPNLRKPDPRKLIPELRKKFGKPIIVIGLESWIRQIGNSDADWPESGADAYFEISFSMDNFVMPGELNHALKYCVDKSLATRDSADALVHSSKTRSLRIVMVNPEPLQKEALEMMIRWHFKKITVQKCGEGEHAFQNVLSTKPDLLITYDRMPVLSGHGLCERLLERQVSYPIIVLSIWEDVTQTWVQEFANRGLNVSFLSVPFDVETFIKAMETALKISRDE